MGSPDAELSLLLTDDAEIRELNGQYRGVDEPTDVLSFSMLEGEDQPPDEMLGDVVISVERAASQLEEAQHQLRLAGFVPALPEDLVLEKARAGEVGVSQSAGVSPEPESASGENRGKFGGLPPSAVENWDLVRELVFLCIHGYLHIIGQHHGSEDDDRLMCEREYEIFKLFEF